MTRHRVLVVGGQAGERAALVERLEREGYATAAARDGEQALEQLRDAPQPSAILIDLSMRAMDGEWLCRVCAATPELRAIPRVLMCGVREALMLRPAAAAWVARGDGGEHLLGVLAHLLRR
jgi:CheY-like chemotaxis protein